MSIPDIEKSIGFVVYTYRDEDEYRGINFDILMKENCSWIVMINGKPLGHELYDYSQAVSYAHGYIDASMSTREDE